MIKNPNDIIEKLTSDFLSVFNTDLISVVLFGSAVSHEYCPGVSEIKTISVLTDTSTHSIQRYVSVHDTWAKQKVITPLFVTIPALQSFSLSRPVQLLDIQSSYRVIYGDDFIHDLQIDQEHLHLQCRFMLQDLALELRCNYLEMAGRKKELQHILDCSMHRMLPVFKALLVLGGRKIPYASSELIASVEDLFGLGASVFSDIYCKSKIVNDNTYEIFEKFTALVDLFLSSVGQSLEENESISIDQHDFRK